MPEDEKLATQELISGFKDIRDKLAVRETSQHQANNAMFKTVAELSMEQIKLRNLVNEVVIRLATVESNVAEGIQKILDQAQANGSKAESVAVVTEKTKTKTDRTFIEQRIGFIVLTAGTIAWEWLKNR